MKADKGRVLVLTKNNFTAERDGGSKRTAAMVQALKDEGFAVDYMTVRPFFQSWAAPRNGTWLAVIRFLARLARTGSLSALKWFSPFAVRAVDAARSEDFVATVVEHSQLALYGRNAPGLHVINTHNVESELMKNYAESEANLAKRLLARYEANALRRLEGSVAASYDIVGVVSGRDSRSFDAIARANNIVVAENGVSEEFFSSARAAGSERNVVFIGHLGWRPNIDAVEWLATKVWPGVAQQNSRARLQLVGRHPAASVRDRASSSIEVHADVPSVEPYLAGATVATAPLRAAGGTRIKILEALATGVPVVSTRLGALGLEHLEGEGLLIEDEPEAFGRRVLDLLESPPPSDVVRATVNGYRWTETMAPLTRAIAQRLQDGESRG